MLVKYREREFLGHYIKPYKCIDHITTVELYKPWRSGSLLYGYVDRFNVKVIAFEDILEMEDGPIIGLNA